MTKDFVKKLFDDSLVKMGGFKVYIILQKRRAILVQNDLFSSTAKTDINSQKNENGLEISYQVISSKVQK